MKQFVLKTPTPLFLLIIFFPIIIMLLPFVEISSNSHPALFTTLNVIRFTAIVMWFSSILDFFCTEKGDHKNKVLIQFLIFISFALSGIAFFSSFWIGFVVALIIWITMIFLLTKKVKSIFYERSTWFIVLELILIPVGIYTLTETIKTWERDKLFSGKD